MGILKEANGLYWQSGKNKRTNWARRGSMRVAFRIAGNLARVGGADRLEKAVRLLRVV
jgi:hypothetical protein